MVGIIPAAGRALRLQPLPGSKELLLVRGRPVMDYLVDRMRATPADELRVVTRPDKPDVAFHARRLGARVVEGTPSSVAQSVRLGVEDLDADDVVLIGFPDTIWEPLSGFAELLGALEGNDAVLGLFRTPDLARSDVVVAEGERVRAIAVKPAEPPSELIWGCAAVRRSALERLAEHDEVGHLLDDLARAGRVCAVHLSDSWLDIGTPEALARAQERA